jgi:hypothetical protein
MGPATRGEKEELHKVFGEGNRASRLESSRVKERWPQVPIKTRASTNAAAPVRTTASGGMPKASAANAPMAPATDATITDSLPGNAGTGRDRR